MKKIYPLIFLLAVLFSCSSDDAATEPEPTQEPELTNQEYITSQLSGNPGFLKAVTHDDYNLSATYSSFFSRSYSYDGNKLSKMFNYSSSGTGGSNLSISVYTYTGDLITQIEQKNRDNVITSTTKYFYDEQQRILKIETTTPEDFNVSEFTNNGDGSVSIVYKEANEAGELEVVNTRINYYNSTGELIKWELLNVETEITYDTSGNPLSLVTGWDKLSIYGPENSHLHNIANIRTITHIEGEPDQIVDRPNTWTYNPSGFPIKQTTSYTNPGNGYPAINNYWYY